jgi:hypothetical protein
LTSHNRSSIWSTISASVGTARGCERFGDRLTRDVSGGVTTHPVGNGPQAEIRQTSTASSLFLRRFPGCARGVLPAIAIRSPCMKKLTASRHQRFTEAD